jgi:hypothetical protein
MSVMMSLRKFVDAFNNLIIAAPLETVGWSPAPMCTLELVTYVDGRHSTIVVLL